MSYNRLFAVIALLASSQVFASGLSERTPFASPTPSAPAPAQVATPTIVSDWGSIEAEVARLYSPVLAAHPWLEVTIAVVRDRDVRYYSFGSDHDRAADEHTVFTINSMTKSFAGLALAKRVVDGELSLDQPVQALVPDHRIPRPSDREITLLDLATHTSGLPRVPSNLVHPDSEDAYRDYSDDLFFTFLAGFNFPADTALTGTHWDYSNLGYGLLGYVLSSTHHQSFAQMIGDQILAPLAMNETSAFPAPLPADQVVAIGHKSQDGSVQPPRSGPETMEGSWSIRSTSSDMAKFIQAYLNPPSGSLGDAINLSQSDERPGLDQGWREGFAWEIRLASNTRTKNGGGGGFSSVMFFNRDRKTGLVVLSNTDDNNSIELPAWTLFTDLR